MTFEDLIANFKDVVTNHYFDFKGRVRRQTFWYYSVVSLMLLVAAALISFVIPPLSIIVPLLALALLLPSVGMSVRRLHDIGMEGWWVLLFFVPYAVNLLLGFILGQLAALAIFVLLVFWCIKPGTVGANQYGPDPKA